MCKLGPNRQIEYKKHRWEPANLVGLSTEWILGKYDSTQIHQ